MQVTVSGVALMLNIISEMIRVTHQWTITSVIVNLEAGIIPAFFRHVCNNMSGSNKVCSCRKTTEKIKCVRFTEASSTSEVFRSRNTKSNVRCARLRDNCNKFC